MGDEERAANPIRALINIDFSKGVEKLVEAIDRHLAAERLPARIRKQARAEAEARIAAADAELAIRDRALRWDESLAIRRQENREAIIVDAADRLREISAGDFSDEQIGEDWLARFFKGSEDVGDEHIRSIWAQILAGEVSQPGSYAVRTLEALRVMSRQEAELFAVLWSHSWMTETGLPIFITESNAQIEAHRDRRGLDLAAVLHLITIGLLGETVSTARFDRVEYHGDTFAIHHLYYKPDSFFAKWISYRPFTQAGWQLSAYALPHHSENSRGWCWSV